MTIKKLPPFDLKAGYEWMEPDAIFAAHFAQGQYWLDDAKGPIAASSLLTTTRSSSIVLPDSAGVFQTLGNNTLPRTDRGLYPNGQATNLLLWSQQFENATWAKSGGGTGSAPTVTANTALAPDGTMTADRIDFDRGAGNTLSDASSISRSVTIAAAGSYTGFIFIKAATASDIGKYIAFRHVAGGAYTIITLTSEYQLVPVTEISTSAGARNFTITSRGGYTSSNQVSVILWGAQLNAGEAAAPYIRTTDEAATLFASDIRAVQGVRPSNSQPEPFAGWEAAGLDDGVTILLDFENRMRQGSTRRAVSLNNASNATVAAWETNSAGVGLRLATSGGPGTFPGGQTGGRSRAACRVMPDGTFALAQEGQGSVVTGAGESPINLASATRLTIGNSPSLGAPWNDWIYELQVCKPLSDNDLLAWVNA